MTEAEAVEAIYQQWEDGWEALHPADPEDPDHVPYVFDNETLTAPAQWARVTIVHADRQQESMGGVGSRRVHITGSIGVQVFSDVNEGQHGRALLCDDVRTALELQSISAPDDDEPIRTFAGATQNPTTDGRWFSATVVIPFRYTATV
jgi:hypothetical protein